MLIDTHCHLDFPELELECQLWLQEIAGLDSASRVAEGRLVERILVPAISAEFFSRVLACAQREPNRIKVALGLHPCFLAAHQAQSLEVLEAQLADNPKVVALGEIGLDAREGQADLAEQIPWLEAQLRLAQRYSKPVLLHVVKAHDQVLALLRRFSLPCGGIVHAFSGSAQQAQQYIALGFCLGVGGVLTYPRAHKLRRLVQQLPLEHWVLETDAPDMVPAGVQGCNSPRYLPEIAHVLAELRQESLANVIAQTGQNACRLIPQLAGP